MMFMVKVKDIKKPVGYRKVQFFSVDLNQFFNQLNNYKNTFGLYQEDIVGIDSPNIITKG